jgi:hypothetical protein
LWTLNTPSRVKDASSLHRMLYKNIFTSCYVLAICKITSVEDAYLETCAPRVVVWIQLIAMKYFEDPRLWQSQFVCDIARASPRLSFHNCSHDIFTDWRPYSLWATFIHAFVGVTLPSSPWRTFSRRNTLASGRRQRLFPLNSTSSTIIGTGG